MSTEQSTGAGGGAAVRFATIDVGSNSVLVHVAERTADGGLAPVADRVEITRLGEGLQATGEISPEAADRNVAALRSFREFADEMGVAPEAIAAVGTMCLRSANNAASFIERAREEAGVSIEVIPGVEEARLSFLAVTSGLAQMAGDGGAVAGSVVVFDVGGGSTEFIFGAGDRIDQRFSFDVGAIRLTEGVLKSDPVTPDELQALRAQLAEELKNVGPAAGGVGTLVGMGGTLTNMAAVMHEMREYDPSLIQGARLTVAEVERQLELYRSLTVEQRRELPGLQPKRADVILAGATIVRTVMERMGASEIVISDRGVRHGLMADRFGTEGA